MGLDLKGCRTLVTGASSGIGAGLAEALAERGAVVGICARRADRLSEVVTRCMEYSPDSRMWAVNLADPDAVDQLAVDVMDAFGGVDLLVNNAGIPKRRHVSALDIDTVTAVMHINYLSPTRLTLDLLPQMLARGSGTIVNVSSIAATLSAPGEAAYDASKAALTAFSEAMAVDRYRALHLARQRQLRLPGTGRAGIRGRRCHSGRARIGRGPGVRARVLPRNRGGQGQGCGRIHKGNGQLPARAEAAEGLRSP
jgi:NAD(P)-dependent dehydrogenase (short-subunit alcohol dehydrogenase family)